MEDVEGRGESENVVVTLRVLPLGPPGEGVLNRGGLGEEPVVVVLVAAR